MRRKRRREHGGEQTRERARREQTLMPPCRPQMLHQLQTSSFLRSPSFPSTRSPQTEKERRGGHMPYSNLPHPVAFTVPHPRRPPLFSFAASSFHSLLSTRSLPAGAMTLGYTWRKGRREKGRERDAADTETVVQQNTNFRLNLTQDAKGC